MIHNAWTYTSGNANDLRKQADDLEYNNSSIYKCIYTRG